MSYPDSRIDTPPSTQPEPMSREDAMAAILQILPLSAEDLEGFLACTPEEQASLLQTYKDAKVPATKSMWDEVLAIMGVCASFANLVMPLGNLISTVYAATKV